MSTRAVFLKTFITFSKSSHIFKSCHDGKFFCVRLERGFLFSLMPNVHGCHGFLECFQCPRLRSGERNSLWINAIRRKHFPNIASTLLIQQTNFFWPPEAQLDLEYWNLSWRSPRSPQAALLFRAFSLSSSAEEVGWKVDENLSSQGTWEFQKDLSKVELPSRLPNSRLERYEIRRVFHSFPARTGFKKPKNTCRTRPTLASSSLMIWKAMKALDYPDNVEFAQPHLCCHLAIDSGNHGKNSSDWRESFTIKTSVPGWDI